MTLTRQNMQGKRPIWQSCLNESVVYLYRFPDGYERMMEQEQFTVGWEDQ